MECFFQSKRGAVKKWSNTNGFTHIHKQRHHKAYLPECVCACACVRLCVCMPVSVRESPLSKEDSIFSLIIRNVPMVLQLSLWPSAGQKHREFQSVKMSSPERVDRTEWSRPTNLTVNADRDTSWVPIHWRGSPLPSFSPETQNIVNLSVLLHNTTAMLTSQPHTVSHNGSWRLWMWTIK